MNHISDILLKLIRLVLLCDISDLGIYSNCVENIIDFFNTAHCLYFINYMKDR